MWSYGGVVWSYGGVVTKLWWCGVELWWCSDEAMVWCGDEAVKRRHLVYVTKDVWNTSGGCEKSVVWCGVVVCAIEV